jgi:hypothetical protein
VIKNFSSVVVHHVILCLKLSLIWSVGTSLFGLMWVRNGLVVRDIILLKWKFVRGRHRVWGSSFRIV